MLGLSIAEVKYSVLFFKMNLRDKYLGTSLGLAWAILNPMCMLCLYTFVFGYVYKARAPGSSTTLSYAIWLISGYGPWLAMTEGLSAATMSIVGSTGLVKNISFKTETLPIAFSLNGLVSMVVSLAFLAILMMIDGNYPSWHCLLVIPLIVLQFVFIMGVAFFCSATQVFVRDFGIILPNLLTIILFATPIFYPVSAFPDYFQPIVYYNPIFVISNAYRSLILDHQLPDFNNMLVTVILTAILFILGLRFFRRLKGHFEAML